MPDKQYVEQNGQKYEVIDPEQYVEQLKETNRFDTVTAEKSGYISVRKGTPGEEIPTYTNDGKLESPEVYQEGKYIATRVDNEGKPVIDKYGHTNQWQIDEDVLRRKYDVGENIPENEMIKPCGGEQTFARIPEPKEHDGCAGIAMMKPWGENGKLIPQTVDYGGYLNVTNTKDIYGIAKNEFAETYRTIESKSTASPQTNMSKRFNVSIDTPETQNSNDGIGLGE